MRWTCADCRREWIFSTASAGQDGCCPACGSTSITQVTYVGDFDLATTPEQLASAMGANTIHEPPAAERETPMALVNSLALSSPEFA